MGFCGLFSTRVSRDQLDVSKTRGAQSLCTLRKDAHWLRWTAGASSSSSSSSPFFLLPAHTSTPEQEANSAWAWIYLEHMGLGTASINMFTNTSLLVLSLQRLLHAIQLRWNSSACPETWIWEISSAGVQTALRVLKTSHEAYGERNPHIQNSYPKPMSAVSASKLAFSAFAFTFPFALLPLTFSCKGNASKELRWLRRPGLGFFRTPET